MAKFTIQGPDGSTYDIEAPDNATDDQVMEFFKQNYHQASQPGYWEKTGQNAMEGLKQAPQVMQGMADTLSKVAPLYLNPVGTLTDSVTQNLQGKPLGDTPIMQGGKALGEFGLNTIKGIGSQLMDVGRAVEAPFQMAAGTPAAETDIAKKFQNEPISTGLNILTSPLLASGLHAEPGPSTAVGSFADELIGSSGSKLAKINKKLANIPENATKMKGYNEPIPTDAEIEQAAQNVAKAYKQVHDDHGAILNAAKEEAGLPASKEDIDFSTRRYGNPFGLNVNAPLGLAEDAPKSFKPGDTVTLTPAKEGLPPLEVTYKGPIVLDTPESLKASGMSDAEIKSATQPSYDINADIPGHPSGSTISEQTLKDAGYQMPDVNKPPMPYSIGAHDTPEQLNVEINRFKSNLPYINKTDRIKAASYFQDQINQQGVFRSDTAKGPVMGRLKGQYGDLADIIKQESPTLQAAKSKFANMKNSLDLVESKIDPERPGQTQANLKRIFLSQSPATQDQLKQLAHFEQLTGKPVVTELFKKFAGKSFEDWLSRPAREITEAGLGAASAILGHPLGAAIAGTSIAAQSPRVLGAVEAAAPQVAAKAGQLASGGGKLAAVQAAKGNAKPFNGLDRPTLQSFKDRYLKRK